MTLCFDDIKPGMLLLKSRKGIIHWVGLISFVGNEISTGQGRRLRRCIVLPTDSSRIQHRWIRERDIRSYTVVAQ